MEIYTMQILNHALASCDKEEINIKFVTRSN